MKALKIKGLPAALFIPAAMYDMEVIVSDVSITIPAKGEYSKEFPDYITDKKEFKCVLQGLNGFYIDYNTVIEVLFASSQYPDMESNTFFSMSGIGFADSENTITIVGNILKFDD